MDIPLTLAAHSLFDRPPYNTLFADSSYSSKGGQVLTPNCNLPHCWNSSAKGVKTVFEPSRLITRADIYI